MGLPDYRPFTTRPSARDFSALAVALAIWVIPPSRGLTAFGKRAREWLGDYALFRALKAK
jgi:4-alpha-glucanotransferase